MSEEKNNRGKSADGNKKDGSSLKLSADRESGKAKKQEQNFFSKLMVAVHNKFGEFKAEFKKIVWPSRETLLKETLTVIVICVIFGVYIALLDGGLGYALSAFSRFAQSFGG
jgi:preprotein translocase subunit SecE